MKQVSCKYCNQGGLYWSGADDTGFKLLDADTGERHDCRSKSKTQSADKGTCRNCGTSGLKWIMVDERGDAHKCQKRT